MGEGDSCFHSVLFDALSVGFPILCQKFIVIVSSAFKVHFRTFGPDCFLSAAHQILLRVLNPDFPIPTRRAKDEPAGLQNTSHKEGPEGFGNITEEDKNESLEVFVCSHCKPSRLRPWEGLLQLQLGSEASHCSTQGSSKRLSNLFFMSMKVHRPWE